MDIITTDIDSLNDNKISTIDSSNNFAKFKEIHEHNEKMLSEVPGLADMTMPIVGNVYFNPATYDLNDDDFENLNTNHTQLKKDSENRISTVIEVDGNKIIINQHISNVLYSKGKSFSPVNALNFNLTSIKQIFKNNIPISFKQSVILLAVSKKDPEILTIAFENEELVDVFNLINEKMHVIETQLKETHNVSD